VSRRCATARGVSVRRSQRAARPAQSAPPTIEALRAAGKTSLRAIAAALNERGIPAPRSGEWQAVQVARVGARRIVWTRSCEKQAV